MENQGHFVLTWSCLILSNGWVSGMLEQEKPSGRMQWDRGRNGGKRCFSEEGSSVTPQSAGGAVPKPSFPKSWPERARGEPGHAGAHTVGFPFLSCKPWEIGREIQDPGSESNRLASNHGRNTWDLI